MERPRYINYQGFTDSKLLNYSIDQDNYIDQLEQENSGLKVQMRALQDSVNDLQSHLKERNSVLLGVAENLDDVVQENIKLESQLKERWTIDEIICELKDIDVFDAEKYFHDKFKE